MEDVVDLVGASSSRNPPSTGATSFAPHSERRRQRRRTKRDREVGNSNHRPAEEAAAGSVNIEKEIIDLEAVDYDEYDIYARSSTPLESKTSGRGKRRRPFRSRMEMDCHDDDVVEIIVPDHSTVASSSSLPSSTMTNRDGNWSSRIRDVFPLASRSKVEALLVKAASYATTNTITDVSDDGENAFHTVMTVLAECDPTGTSISDASFAAAAVGGRLCVEGGGGRQSSPSGRNRRDSSSSTSGGGRRKVAKLECQCCFAEHDYEDMVSCRLGGHLFCMTCLQRHTEQRVFGVGNFGVTPAADAVTNAADGTVNGARRRVRPSSRALEILCMASDCTSGFREGQLRRALSEKVLKKYNELQYAAVIENANMKDVSRCPKCHFIAVRADALPPQLFHCPPCGYKSCTECGEEYHPGIRCDQVESKNETDGRTKVEEAMTLALVRTCPRPFCRKKFLKNDGCNKMTCSCGCFVCYVCGKEIPATVGYNHFCQT